MIKNCFSHSLIECLSYIVSRDSLDQPFHFIVTEIQIGNSERVSTLAKTSDVFSVRNRNGHQISCLSFRYVFVIVLHDKIHTV